MRSPKSLHAIRACLCVLALAISGHVSLLAVSGPPLRTGLWVTQRVPETTAAMSHLESMVRTNPNLSGVCLYIGWKEVEKEAGHLDFSAIDKAVDVLRAKGMKYELNLKPGVNTPPFVYQQGGSSV